nr:GIY-YIG endonuclease [Fusarium aethiopicum]
MRYSPDLYENIRLINSKLLPSRVKSPEAICMCNYTNKYLFSSQQGGTLKITKRFYSDASSPSINIPTVNPTPVLVIRTLHDKGYVDSYKEILKNKGGIYSFINTVNGKQYIGSAKDFYIRLNEHLNNKKSNLRACWVRRTIQKAFDKYGLDKFNWIIYEYFSYETKILSNESLTELGASPTSYIKALDFSTLYNMKREASSMLGYKHTDEAIQKMIERYKDKTNHPMFGKSHSQKVLELISKPGELNPMFGRIHSDETKKLMAKKRNKYSNGVGIFDLEDNLIKKFDNNVELANYLNISKVTVVVLRTQQAMYLNNELIYKNMYIFKPIN